MIEKKTRIMWLKIIVMIIIWNDKYVFSSHSHKAKLSHRSLSSVDAARRLGRFSMLIAMALAYNFLHIAQNNTYAYALHIFFSSKIDILQIEFNAQQFTLCTISHAGWPRWLVTLARCRSEWSDIAVVVDGVHQNRIRLIHWLGDC